MVPTQTMSIAPGEHVPTADQRVVMSRHIEVHVLHDGQSVRDDGSACLPGRDLALVCTLLDRPTVLQAVRAFRDALSS